MKKTSSRRKGPSKSQPSGIYFGGDADIEGNVNTGNVKGNMEYKKVETGDIGAGAQAVIGIDQSNISQYQGISGKDLVEVQNLFAGLRTELEKQDVPEVTKEMGKEFVNQIEEEVTKKDAPPDGSVIKVAGNWLLKNIPSIAGTLANVFINPIVGKVVQAAGEIATKWVQEKFSPAEKGA